jgi:hypothetical protein
MTPTGWSIDDARKLGFETSASDGRSASTRRIVDSRWNPVRQTRRMLTYFVCAAASVVAALQAWIH